MKMLFALAVLLFAAISTAHGDLFVASGDSNKIEILNVGTGVVVKTFKVREYSGIYVTLHYKEDVLFYSSSKKLYKIHLLDDSGNRKVSGRGELFTDGNADHSETLMLTEKSNIYGLTVDPDNNKLYIAVYNTIYEMDFDGSNRRSVVIGGSLRSPVFLDGSLYFSMDKTWKIMGGIYRVNLRQSPDKGQELVQPGSQDVFTLDVDPYSKKLFFRRGSVVHVIDTNLTASSYPVSNPRVVLSDSQFLGGRGLLPIAIRWKYLVFLKKDSSYGQLYVGILNSALNFISKKNVYVYGKPRYEYRPYQLALFEHQPSSTNPKPTGVPPTLQVCSCPSS